MAVELQPELKTEERAEVIWADPITRNFLLEAQADGAIDRFLAKDPKPVEVVWYQRRPLARYRGEDLFLTRIYFATQFSTQELIYKLFEKGKPITREWYRQIIKKTITGIWDEVSPELQERYPLEEIPLRKPDSPYVVEKRSNSIRGPLTKAILERARAGASYEQLVEIAGNSNALSCRRATVKRVGIEAPYSKWKSPEEVEKRDKLMKEPDAPFKEVKKIFEDLSDGRIRASLQSGVLISMMNLTFLAGIHPKTDKFELLRDILEAEGIAIAEYQNKGKENRILRGFGIRAVDIEKAKQVLRAG